MGSQGLLQKLTGKTCYNGKAGCVDLSKGKTWASTRKEVGKFDNIKSVMLWSNRNPCLLTVGLIALESDLHCLEKLKAHMDYDPQLHSEVTLWRYSCVPKQNTKGIHSCILYNNPLAETMKCWPVALGDTVFIMHLYHGITQQIRATCSMHINVTNLMMNVSL